MNIENFQIEELNNALCFIMYYNNRYFKAYIHIYDFTCDKIQHMLLFLGVHKFGPILTLHGKMGWIFLSVHRSVSMAIIWNKVMDMNNTRLTIMDIPMSVFPFLWLLFNFPKLYVRKCGEAQVLKTL